MPAWNGGPTHSFHDRSFGLTPSCSTNSQVRLYCVLLGLALGHPLEAIQKLKLTHRGKSGVVIICTWPEIKSGLALDILQRSPHVLEMLLPRQDEIERGRKEEKEREGEESLHKCLSHSADFIPFHALNFFPITF